MTHECFGVKMTLESITGSYLNLYENVFRPQRNIRKASLRLINILKTLVSNTFSVYIQFFPRRLGRLKISFSRIYKYYEKKSSSLLHKYFGTTLERPLASHCGDTEITVKFK